MKRLREILGAMTRKQPAYVALFLWVLILALLLVPAVAILSAENGQHNRAFEVALETTLDLDRPEPVEDLIPLVAGHPGQRWDPGTNPPRVLVATFASYHGYPDNERKECKLKKPVWVSPVPQLQEQCRAFALSGAEVEQRIAEYLGLRPGPAKGSIVELWVEPRDAFRPCPDPDIEDRTCRRGLPAIPEAPEEAEDQEGPPAVQAPEESQATAAREKEYVEALAHARWFQQKFEGYYERPYPWTRLGYTYDWGNPNSSIGASEYVVRENATVGVASVTPVDEYCASESGGPDRAPPGRFEQTKAPDLGC